MSEQDHRPPNPFPSAAGYMYYAAYTGWPPPASFPSGPPSATPQHPISDVPAEPPTPSHPRGVEQPKSSTESSFTVVARPREYSAIVSELNESCRLNNPDEGAAYPHLYPPPFVYPAYWRAPPTVPALPVVVPRPDIHPVPTWAPYLTRRLSESDSSSSLPDNQIYHCTQCHHCAVCKKPRSRRFHHRNPLFPGDDPVATVCSRCTRNRQSKQGDDSCGCGRTVEPGNVLLSRTTTQNHSTSGSSDSEHRTVSRTRIKITRRRTEDEPKDTYRHVELRDVSRSKESHQDAQGGGEKHSPEELTDSSRPRVQNGKSSQGGPPPGQKDSTSIPLSILTAAQLEQVRHIARETVERYRQAERRVEASPGAFAHGHFIEVSSEEEDSISSRRGSSAHDAKERRIMPETKSKQAPAGRSRSVTNSLITSSVADPPSDHSNKHSRDTSRKQGGFRERPFSSRDDAERRIALHPSPFSYGYIEQVERQSRLASRSQNRSFPTTKDKEIHGSSRSPQSTSSDGSFSDVRIDRSQKPAHSDSEESLPSTCERALRRDPVNGPRPTLQRRRGEAHPRATSSSSDSSLYGTGIPSRSGSRSDHDSRPTPPSQARPTWSEKGVRRKETSYEAGGSEHLGPSTVTTHVPARARVHDEEIFPSRSPSRARVPPRAWEHSRSSRCDHTAHWPAAESGGYRMNREDGRITPSSTAEGSVNERTRLRAQSPPPDAVGIHAYFKRNGHQQLERCRQRCMDERDHRIPSSRSPSPSARLQPGPLASESRRCGRALERSTAPSPASGGILKSASRHRSPSIDGDGRGESHRDSRESTKALASAPKVVTFVSPPRPMGGHGRHRSDAGPARSKPRYYGR